MQYFFRWLRKPSGPPLIIYQMGKVGSSSIKQSLEEHGYHPFYHIHRMHPDSIQQVEAGLRAVGAPSPQHHKIGAKLYKSIILKGKAAKFITPVREPLSRNMSGFFQNIHTMIHRSLGEPRPVADFTVDELIDIFLESYNHEVPLNWFDDEMKRTIGIDIYEHPFPQEKGIQVLQKGPFEVLLLKSEISDQKKEQAIIDFLGWASFKLSRSNVTEQKNTGDIYQNFKDQIILPQSYIDRMLESRYARHFYSEEERAQFQRKIKVEG